MCRCPTTSCSSSCSSQEHTLKMRGATRRFPGSSRQAPYCWLPPLSAWQPTFPTSTTPIRTARKPCAARASWYRPVMPPNKPAADWTATTSPTGAMASAKPGRSSFPTSKAVPPPPPSARAKPPWRRLTRCTGVCTTHSRSTSAASPGPPAPSMWAHSYCSSSCWAASS